MVHVIYSKINKYTEDFHISKINMEFSVVQFITTKYYMHTDSFADKKNISPNLMYIWH